LEHGERTHGEFVFFDERDFVFGELVAGLGHEFSGKGGLVGDYSGRVEVCVLGFRLFFCEGRHAGWWLCGLGCCCKRSVDAGLVLIEIAMINEIIESRVR
jgi:hypothetical protein